MVTRRRFFGAAGAGLAFAGFGPALGTGLRAAAAGLDDAVVVNTCAFIDAARQESIDTILALADTRAAGARLVVTGCLAERSGPELAAALPEVDAVVGFAGEADLATIALDPPRRRNPKSPPES